MNPEETPNCWTSTHHQRKRTLEIVQLSKAKLAPGSESVDCTKRCSSKYKCFGKHSSADTAGYGTAEQTSHSWTSVD
ncbi:transposable element Tc1 transposase [Trichonephila clavipes]|nr:transposable element Tc1 transposase [Trichonephila clavipes]